MLDEYGIPKIIPSLTINAIPAERLQELYRCLKSCRDAVIASLLRETISDYEEIVNG